MSPSAEVAVAKTAEKFTVKPLSSAKEYRLWAVRVMSKLQQMKEWDTQGKTGLPKDSEESKNFIVGTLADNLLETLLDTDMKAPTIWAALQKAFLVHSLSAQSIAITSLMNFNYSEPSMEANKTALLSLQRELRTAFENADSIKISDLVMLFALVNVPAEYHSLRTTLEETNKTGLSMDALFESLVREEASAISSASRASRAGGPVPPGENCSHDRDGATCWSCHPELRPVCTSCKNKGIARFYHHRGSRFCKDALKAGAAKAAANLAVGGD